MLFVYGTLRRGFNHPMSRFLAHHGKFLGRARLAGRLYRLGAYPGLTPAKREGEWVEGDLYELEGRSSVWRRLDRYEGITPLSRRGEYRRELRTVLLDGGASSLAWVYLYQREVAGWPRLITGDFLRQRRRPPPR